MGAWRDDSWGMFPAYGFIFFLFWIHTIFHVVSRESPLRASRCYKDGALIHKASLQDLSLEDYYMLIYDFQLDNYPSKASSKLI